MLKNKAAQPLLTVFTPTFNRLSTLVRTYESLCAQTSGNFRWLIVDDGSSDNTREAVEGWQAENLIEIQYIYKENGGMHTAHNAAYDSITTELNTCIDSDDAMPPDAVEQIERCWEKHRGSGAIGIIGLDFDMNGRLIGTPQPKGVASATFSDFYFKHHAGGDKKFVYLTEVMKRVDRYPEFEGEKLVPLSFKYVQADKFGELLLLDKALCRVEYLPDGSSGTIVRQYFKSTQGFIAARKNMMLHSPYLRVRARESAHYVAESLIARNRRFIRSSPKPFLTALTLLPGIALYIMLRKKAGG